MIHNFISEHQLLNWPLLTGALIIWAIFLWKEWRQFPQPRFFIKGCVALLVVASLVMILIRPALKSKSGHAAILTEGFRKQQLDSLRKSHRNLKILAYHPNRPLPDSLRGLNALYVLGEGVQTFDLWQLEKFPAVYLPGSVQRGIVKLRYPREPIQGDLLRINGIFNHPQKNHRVVLEGPGGITLDSFDLDIGEEQAFKLSTELKASGNFLFAISEKDSSGKVITKEELPVHIRPRTKLKVWIMNGVPNFETRHLKNYLAESGHQVLVRNQVSRNRFKTEFLNMGEDASYAFTAENLDQFDLLIIDAAAYRKLSSQFMRVLEKAIGEGGLGVFIQSDNQFLKSPGNLGDFLITEDKSVSVVLDAWPDSKVEKWPYRLQVDIGLQSQQATGEGILTGYKRIGQGRLGLTVFQNTYRLLLDGHRQQYRKIWADILSAVSRRDDPIAYWSTPDKLIYKDQPFRFELRTGVEKPIVILNDDYPVAMASKVDVPYVWEGTSFPVREGWNMMGISGDSTAIYNFYVLDTTQWRSLRMVQTMEENTRAFSEDLRTPGAQISSRPISPIWFFLLFLSGMTFLWLEPKIYSS